MIMEVVLPVGSVVVTTLGASPAHRSNGVTEPSIATESERGDGLAGPVLVGRQVRLRPGRPGDAAQLHAILAEPSVSRWWGDPDPVTVIEEALRQYERGGDGRFHDGLLMDLLRGQLASD